MRLVCSSLVFALVAGCATAGGPAITSSADPQSQLETTTTPPDIATTTSEVATRVDVCSGRAVVWEPGRDHVADCFVTPVSFRVDDPGWRSFGADEGWVFVSWVDPEDQAFRVNVAFTAEPAGQDPEAAVQSILRPDGIVGSGEPMSQSVAGLMATTIDVEGAAFDTVGLSGRECVPDGSFVFFSGDQEAYPVVEAFGGNFFGVGACQVVRLWSLEVDGRTLTILGGTADPDRHRDAVAAIDVLFEALTVMTP